MNGFVIVVYLQREAAPLMLEPQVESLLVVDIFCYKEKNTFR